MGLVSFFPAWLFDRSPIWHSTNGIFMEITCQNIWIGKQYFTATGIRSLKTLIYTLGYSNWISFNMKHYWKILNFIPHFSVEKCVTKFSFFNLSVPCLFKWFSLKSEKRLYFSQHTYLQMAKIACQIKVIHHFNILNI